MAKKFINKNVFIIFSIITKNSDWVILTKNLVTFKRWGKMGLRMKNFNIMGVHWKIQFSRVGFTKNQYIEGIAWKEGLGQFSDLRKSLAKKREGRWGEGGGGDTPMYSMKIALLILRESYWINVYSVLNNQGFLMILGGIKLINLLKLA